MRFTDVTASHSGQNLPNVECLCIHGQKLAHLELGDRLLHSDRDRNVQAGQEVVEVPGCATNCQAV